MEKMICFMLGTLFCMLFVEPLIINFVYFTNIDLFHDIILTRNNREKLRHYYMKVIFGGKKNG